MNSLKLKYLVAVDRCGSFTAAAKAVHLSQSALTKNIAEIEAEIGFALFERHARGVYATVEGRTFIDRAARIVTDFDQLLADAKVGRQLSNSRIRIGVGPPSLVSLLNTALPKLLDLHPEVCVEQTADWVEQSIHRLANRDLDLLVGPAPLIRQQRQFVVRELAPFGICFFVRHSHPLARKKELNINELSGFPMALADRSVATPELMQQLFGAPEIPAEKQLHIIGHFSSACKIVANTDTVGTVAVSYRENRTFLRDFSILEIVDKVDPIPLVVAYHAKFLPSRPMQSLLDILEMEPHWLSAK